MESINCGKCCKSIQKDPLTDKYCILNENTYSPGYGSSYDGKTLVYNDVTQTKYEILCYECMKTMIDSGELKFDSCSADMYVIQIPFDELPQSSMKRLKKLEENLKESLQTIQDFINSKDR